METLDPKSCSLDQLGSTLELPAPRGPMRLGTRDDILIRPPGSKSLTNRALLLASLCAGESTLTHALLDADDAKRMIRAVGQLGARVDISGNQTHVHGVSGAPRVDPSDSVLDLNNAGTATRFLGAVSLLCDTPVTITGNERMQQRPIGELGDLLKRLGAKVEYLKNAGFPPLKVSAPGSLEHASVEVEPTQSSQFVSALLLVAPFIDGGITLTMPRGVTSPSYVRMTLDLLEDLGARVQRSEDLSTIRVQGPVNPFKLDIEPDASGATYWWSAGALLNNTRVMVEGFGHPNAKQSLQGDADYPLLLERMGCELVTSNGALASVSTGKLEPILCDMTDMPDAVMSLAAVASFAPGTTIVRGVKTLRVKECDRIRAMHNELKKVGVHIEEDLKGDPDVLSITPPERGVDCSDNAPRVEFETYDDHRMAMSLSLLALRRPNIVIKDPSCVAKTYATYWEHFSTLYA